MQTERRPFPNLRARAAAPPRVSGTRLWQVLSARVTHFTSVREINKHPPKQRDAQTNDCGHLPRLYYGRRNETCPQADTAENKECGAEKVWRNREHSLIHRLTAARGSRKICNKVNCYGVRKIHSFMRSSANKTKSETTLQSEIYLILFKTNKRTNNLQSLLRIACMCRGKMTFYAWLCIYL